MKRTDIHRPSVIDPTEYEFVAHECIQGQGLEMMAIIMEERKRFQAHKEQTGGNYSSHEHGGNCMVCGSVNAIYTNIFYHSKSNTYVRVGSDCTEKLWNGEEFGVNDFRKGIADAREYQKGKQKAQALIGDKGLNSCWDLYVAEWDENFKWEERTIRDIVGKLVQYGSLSDKQWSFLSSLVEKIAKRAEVIEKRKAESADAKDAPEGKQDVEVEIVSIKEQEGYYGVSYKMLVKSSDGWRAWGTHPSSCPSKGSTIKLRATFTRSNDDPKFAFFKRPSVLEIIKDVEDEEEFDDHTHVDRRVCQGIGCPYGDIA